MITQEEIIVKLEEMLPAVGTNSLYGSRIRGIIDKLKRGEYIVSDQLLSHDPFIYELNMAGFGDIAKQLTKGGVYGRYNS